MRQTSRVVAICFVGGKRLNAVCHQPNFHQVGEPVKAPSGNLPFHYGRSRKDDRDKDWSEVYPDNQYGDSSYHAAFARDGRPRQQQPSTG